MVSVWICNGVTQQEDVTRDRSGNATSNAMAGKSHADDWMDQLITRKTKTTASSRMDDNVVKDPFEEFD